MSKMKLMKTIVSISLAMMMLNENMVMANDGAKLYQTKTCHACHGNDAKTPLLPFYPKLAGQNKEYLIIQMRDIKSGARKNGSSIAMKGIMDMVSDQEIKRIAEWLASLESTSTAPVESNSALKPTLPDQKIVDSILNVESKSESSTPNSESQVGLESKPLEQKPSKADEDGM
jgi:cytochrome c